MDAWLTWPVNTLHCTNLVRSACYQCRTYHEPPLFTNICRCTCTRHETYCNSIRIKKRSYFCFWKVQTWLHRDKYFSRFPKTNINPALTNVFRKHILFNNLSASFFCAWCTRASKSQISANDDMIFLWHRNWLILTRDSGVKRQMMSKQFFTFKTPPSWWRRVGRTKNTIFQHCFFRSRGGINDAPIFSSILFISWKNSVSICKLWIEAPQGTLTCIFSFLILTFSLTPGLSVPPPPFRLPLTPWTRHQTLPAGKSKHKSIILALKKRALNLFSPSIREPPRVPYIRRRMCQALPRLCKTNLSSHW